jgi:aminoglycoside phosphotransferase family enzyme
MNFDQQNIILQLKKSTAYSHSVYRIKVLETHISWLLLTGSLVYKIKKEVKFGNILDFSTLGLRKKFCQKEYKLNRILCGDMYQSVVKIIQKNGIIRFADLEEKGKPLEYAVKMIEIPQRFRMDNLVKSGSINKKTIKSLIDILVKFHNNAPTNNKISKFALPQLMKKKIDENFETLSKLAKIDPIFEFKLNSFLKDNYHLFNLRIKESKIRDIHGDLYLKNIFIIGNRFYLYDRLEFNDSIRYADVVEDVAHLAMDLDYHRQKDLREYFISQYIKNSNDKNIINLVYFMMCYKACVRTKVSLFRATEFDIYSKKKIPFEREAKNHLRLARKYLKLF